ncbi:hypothetical protein CTAYLR_009725 [Chrysophaeum taylorii]|uniref:Kinesin-like protein n=1 Tax=Chrysophaeum taylorii TaxID=2483200 RepID=A0AAD7XSH1_9STRA|nr:hypothetical protein CTAYLR_009725 [Chrysophaeum taylorii]
MAAHQVVSDYTAVSENANVKVFVRARPPLDDENGEEELFEVEAVEHRAKITMKSQQQWGGGVGGNAFVFDGIFWCDAQQEKVFEEVCREQVDHVLKGFDACCFAYGQTGSGKTYSMFGGGGGGRTRTGIIPRAIDYLFERATGAIHVSFLEIYCDTIRDLGKASRLKKTTDVYLDAAAARLETFGGGWSSPEDFLEIREERGVVFVKGLALIPVESSREALEIVEAGLAMRATECTSMNDTSSRSHTVFTIEVEMEEGVVGKLHLVDLAGSERLKKSESSGLRLREALHINKSLAALGKVIVALDPLEEKIHVPYRDSKLTRILQNALGGDSYATLLATIRPSRLHADECLSTLQFANRCRRVENNPRVHHRVVVGADSRGVRKLVDQVTRLKEEREQLLLRLSAATGEDVSSKLEEERPVLLPSSHCHLLQGTVVSAVQAALRAAGVEAWTIDEATGGVKLSDGTLLEATTPAAFVGLSEEGQRRQKLLKSSASPAIRASAARVARFFGWSPLALPPGLVSILSERETEFERLQKKLDDARILAETQRGDLETLRQKMATDAFHHRKKEHALRETVRRLSLQSDVATHALKHDHQKAIDTLLHAPSQQQQQQQQQQEKKAPPKTTTVIVVKEKKKKVVRPPPRTTTTTVFDAKAVEAIKHQYEYWLKEKDKDAARFIEELNAYRERKREQLTRADADLVRLWRAHDRSATLLCKIRNGKFPLCCCQANNVTAPDFELPPRLGLDALPATRRALSKTRHQPPAPQEEEEEEEDEPRRVEADEDVETRVAARVAAELAAHPTVQYMRDLEARAARAEKKASEETRRHAIGVSGGRLLLRGELFFRPRQLFSRRVEVRRELVDAAFELDRLLRRRCGSTERLVRVLRARAMHRYDAFFRLSEPRRQLTNLVLELGRVPRRVGDNRRFFFVRLSQFLAQFPRQAPHLLYLFEQNPFRQYAVGDVALQLGALRRQN